MCQKILLPALQEVETEDIVTCITNSLSFPRNVLASAEDIEAVWYQLKPELNNVREEYRHEMLARMVIAIRVGLFSSAVNEIWNTTMLVLRDKIQGFGLNEANQFLSINLDDKKFKELKDKELLNISVELGLLSEDSYFFLNHCRDIRNNYSSAHPSKSMLDGVELIYFIHQCVKQVLCNNIEYRGFRSDRFLSIIKGTKLDKESLDELSDRITHTNDIQKIAILKALFGIYVDEKNEEFIRQNCLNLSRMNWNNFSEQAKAEVVVMYSEYLVEDNTKKQYAKLFFEKMHSIDLLPKNDQVIIISTLIKQLTNAHFDIDNFYNEAAFAKRLCNISKKIPLQLTKDFVYIIALCYVGNQYGTSNSAYEYYERIISNFTVREINKLFELSNEENYLNSRLKNYPRCKKQFKNLLNLLNQESIPSKWVSKYKQLKEA